MSNVPLRHPPQEPPALARYYDLLVTCGPHIIGSVLSEKNSIHDPRSRSMSHPTCYIRTQWFLVSTLPPPDLTRYIIQIDYQCLAGGFGDVYRCRYLGGAVPQKVLSKWDSRCMLSGIYLLYV